MDKEVIEESDRGRHGGREKKRGKREKLEKGEKQAIERAKRARPYNHLEELPKQRPAGGEQKARALLSKRKFFARRENVPPKKRGNE